MTERTKRPEEPFKSWSESQQRIWQDWLDTVERFGRLQSGDVLATSLEACKDSLKKALDAQAEGTRVWAENLTTWAREMQDTSERQNATEAQTEGTRMWAESLTSWARQVEEMTASWTESQKQLWENWFESVRQQDPSRAAGSGGAEGQRLMQAWQEAVRNALDTQAQWARLWTAGRAGEKTRRGRRPGA